MVYLTDAQVRDVRLKWAKGQNGKTLAEAYACAPQTISMLVIGQRRRDAGGPISEPDGPYRGRKVTRALLATLQKQRKTGLTLAAIGVKNGLSKATVSKALAGKHIF